MFQLFRRFGGNGYKHYIIYRGMYKRKIVMNLILYISEKSAVNQCILNIAFKEYIAFKVYIV